MEKTDLELLEEADDSDKLSVAQREIVEDMMDKLMHRPLTEKQRALLEAMIEGRRYEPPVEPLPALASSYPRGREVETPAVLRNLPKKPPRRV